MGSLSPIHFCQRVATYLTTGIIDLIKSTIVLFNSCSITVFSGKQLFLDCMDAVSLLPQIKTSKMDKVLHSLPSWSNGWCICIIACHSLPGFFYPLFCCYKPKPLTTIVIISLGTQSAKSLPISRSIMLIWNEFLCKLFHFSPNMSNTLKYCCSSTLYH